MSISADAAEERPPYEASPSPPVLYPSAAMGHSHLQFEVCRVTGGLLISYFASEGRRVRVGGEMNLVVREGPPEVRVVPDLYVLEDEPQSGPKVPAWRPQEHGGKVPSLVIEVVSDSYRKDYDPDEALARYEELRVPEVVRYDPDFAAHRRSRYPRRLLTHFALGAHGRMEALPEIAPGDRVLIRRYPVWLIHQPPYVLRLATGTPDDLHLWPTELERAAHAEDRARRAEERVRALEAELSRVRGG